jgi:hypothetical protein
MMYLPFMKFARFATLLLVGFLLSAFADNGRFFQATEGFVQAKDLPDDFRAQVRSIQLSVKDAFEGSEVHSDAERWMFDVGNKLHIESRAGTVRRRLLFHEGDSLTKDLLLETEKALRGEEFFADAVIEVKRWEDGSAHVIVTTYDQWTTTPGVGFSYHDEELFYWFGLVESNLLGTGQRVGFFRGHDQLRDTWWMDYNNNALLSQRLRLSAHTAWLSDGYSLLLSVSKPLETHADRFAFSASISDVELSEYVYFDANDLDRLPDSMAQARSGRYNILARFDRVDTHDFNVSVTRSYGYKTKFNVSPTFDRKDRYNNSTLGFGSPEWRALVPPPPSALFPDERTDDMLGVSLSLYQYAYKTVHNFNNLKWGETLETGWRLSSKTAMNQEWLGARNSDWYFSHAAVYNNAWLDAFFLNSSASMHYYLADGGTLDDGYASAWGEIQWKPVYLTSTFLSTQWVNLFAADKSKQLTLGVDEGLNGYPSFYYAGQARFLVELEQRLFPPFEIGTLVPAFALFADAGNTFKSYEEFDPDNLHYALGFGVRLGYSKSVQKVVNHLNISWPIGDKYLTGPSISLIAKKNL